MGTHIEIEPGYEAALAAAGLRTFDDFLNAKAGSPTSKHRHRETVPIEFAVDCVVRKFFLKRVFRVPPAHVLGPLLKLRLPLSQPAHEWNICGAMKAAGLPAMQRVAFGERRMAGVPAQAFLLVEATTIEHTVEEWIVPGIARPRELSGNERNVLFRELASLARSFSSKGFYWPDCDAKHIFAEPSNVPGASTWKFCLIDLERVKRVKRASNGNEVTMFVDAYVSVFIGMLIESLSPLVLNEAERKLIFMAADLSSEKVPYSEVTAQKLFGDRARLPDDFVHPRRRHFKKLGDMHVDERFTRCLEAAKIKTMEDVFKLEAGVSLSKPGLAKYRDRIRLTLPVADGRIRTAYLKRYRRPPWREQLRRIAESGFKRSSARREERFTRILSGLGIPTMTTIAYGQKMSAGIEKRSFLVTDEVPGTSLEKLAGDKSTRLSPVEKYEVIRQLALIVSRMHIGEIFHRDLYLSHVFLSRNAVGEIVLHLIDLGRMISNPIRGWRWLVKDLAALNYSSPKGLVTRADGVRFMYHYLAVSSKRKKPEKHQLDLLRTLQKAIDRRNKLTAAHDKRRRARLNT
ncbi:MAG: hypothetical protein IPK83_13205 [Planctomycetes bacterium]|nr:hypothetical protein [Planctomycetota bacterium]